MAHLACVLNTLSIVFGNRGPTTPASAGLAGPEEPESGAGPGHDAVRLDDNERIPPAGPQFGQKGPEETVDRPQMWAFGPAVVQDRQLLPEG